MKFITGGDGGEKNMSEDEILKNLEDLLKKSSCGNYPPEFYLDNREALERFIRLIPS